MTNKKFPNILFLLIDCVRADLCFGEKRSVRTPTTDALVQKGTSFTQAIATNSTTSPCVATILTGMYPFVHGIRSLKGYKLNPNCTTLAEILKNNGYTTYAMVTGPLSKEMGLDRGFDRYLYRENTHTIYTGFAEELISYLKGEKINEPWFLFVHLYEIHVPRKLLKEYSSRKYGKNLYEQAFSSLDYCLGKILEHVDFNTTLVILHSDHGERPPNFLFDWMTKYRKTRKLYLKLYKIWMGQEKGPIPFIQIGHAYHVYECLVKVPLIFVGDKVPQGKIINEQVGQVDIFPTIIDFLGIDHNIPFHGRSLLPLINGEKLEESPLYMEAFPFITAKEEKNWIVGIRTPEWKFVFAPKSKKRKPELYNLKQDPEESKNLFDKQKEIAYQLKEKLLKNFSINLEKVELPGIKMSEEEDKKIANKLKELGYM
jgi:arylsulfatase A-like enzyme